MEWATLGIKSDVGGHAPLRTRPLTPWLLTAIPNPMVWDYAFAGIYTLYFSQLCLNKIDFLKEP
jgi:hypothetical protein